MTLPTFNELCDHFGYRRNDDERPGLHSPRPDYVSAESSAEAWTFVMLARSRGWIVSDPMPNGYKDINHVTIWKKAGADITANGRFRSER